MQTNAAGKGPVGAEPKANKGKSKSWVGAHRGLVIAMVVALLGLYYFVKRNSSTANSSSSTDATGGANSGFAVPAASLGMSGDPAAGGFVDPNSVSGLMNQMLAGQAGLADSISGLLGAQGTTSAGAAAGSVTGTDVASTAGASAPAASPSAPVVIMHNPPSGTTSGNGAAHKTTPTPKKHTAAPTHKKAAKPAAAAHTYTVRRGDSLSSIARRLHVSGGWQRLYDENRKTVGGNPNLIHAGLVLHY